MSEDRIFHNCPKIYELLLDIIDLITNSDKEKFNGVIFYILIDDAFLLLENTQKQYFIFKTIKAAMKNHDIYYLSMIVGKFDIDFMYETNFKYSDQKYYRKNFLYYVIKYENINAHNYLKNLKNYKKNIKQCGNERLFS